MPSQRLLAMGLLSKHPTKSSVLKRFISPIRCRHYTDYERMHIVALWYTPALSKEWIFEQLQNYGLARNQAKDRFSNIVYNPKYRDRWRHLGQQNILHIGQPEVERYFNRSNIDLRVPFWALPIINDEVKSGMSKQAVARKYGLNKNTMKKCMDRSMFDPPRLQGVNPWTIGKGKVDGQPFK